MMRGMPAAAGKTPAEDRDRDDLDRRVGDVRSLASRLENARLATTVLAAWCRERGIADGNVLVRLVADADPENLDFEGFRALGLDGPAGEGAGENPSAAGLVFRKVELRLCGLRVAEATNWYFPARLTAEMRARITTDCPFGEAIEALQPIRRTLWVRPASPAAIVSAVTEFRERRQAGTAAADRMGGEPSDLLLGVPVIEVRALLHRPDGTPLSLVQEKIGAVVVA
ncbi:hypothetical protein A33M_2889 [Rhodovulum sp. PH10]|uniref:hypothetical protein n=1 Tax=Rhodovulum sp. PH10 TaxID=1187851 RepID=UPI00027C2A51|nr:hypothetical protein [Rhodovulum sp. PH10]EJW11692.1 hypothetical protein A33M_2889 [Rhodovulum sp. PH10]